MNLGMHFRLDEFQVAPLLAAGGDARGLRDYLVETLESDDSVFDAGCETDKAWLAIALALRPLGWPARGVIEGGRSLLVSDQGWVTHADPDEVAQVAAFLSGFDDDAVSAAYDAIPEPDRTPEYGDDERTFVLEWFAGLREFFPRAANERQHAVFNVWF